MTSHLEVSQCSLGDWEKAIMMGYDVWRQVEKYQGGMVVVDLDARSITYQIGDHVSTEVCRDNYKKGHAVSLCYADLSTP
jgi:hypothetical protein